MEQKQRGLLIQGACRMRERSYAPYSGFSVGAALLTEDGRIYYGCNIENASFTPTVCAERTAVFHAVSEGCRSFSAIAIAGGKQGEAPADFCPPCGVCRQVLAEFCPPDMPVLLVKSETEVKQVLLKELLPLSFHL